MSLAFPLNAAAQERSGFLDFNAYWDARTVSTLTVNALVNLPGSVQYFGFVNYQSASDEVTADLSSYYSEHHFRWAPWSTVPLDVTALWNTRSGNDNDVAYLGVRLRVSDTGGVGRLLRAARIMYAVNAHAVRFGARPDVGWAPQLEHAYRWDAVPGRIYLAGFADHNLWFDGPEGAPRVRTVSEHQVGLRLVNRVHAVVEWRLNQYLPSDDRMGVGIGLQYVVPFMVR